MNDDAKLDARMPNSMLSHTSIWRKRQVGVISSEKASSLMRTYSDCRFSSFLSVSAPLSWSYADFSPICRPVFFSTICHFPDQPDAGTDVIQPLTITQAKRRSSRRVIAHWGWPCSPGTTGRFGTPRFVLMVGPCHARIRQISHTRFQVG